MIIIVMLMTTMTIIIIIGEPNNGQGNFEEDCTLMYQSWSYHWVDFMCIPPNNQKFSFVCESTTVDYPSSKPTKIPSLMVPTPEVKISGSFGLTTSSSVNSIFDSVCNSYCDTIKKAIARRYATNIYDYHLPY